MMYEDDTITKKAAEPAVSHYYGNTVRLLFLAGALIMLLGLPFFVSYLKLPVGFSVVAILILCAAAGLTNPRQIWIGVVNIVISAAGFIVFQAYAMKAYAESGAAQGFFIATVALEIIFLFAVYFSIKSWRGVWLGRKR